MSAPYFLGGYHDTKLYRPAAKISNNDLMTSHQRPKRRHHHVWQHYLKPWTTNGSIWCLQDGRSYATGTTAIAVERDFYKLDALTDADVDLIRSFFADAHPAAKRNYENLIEMLTRPFRLLEKHGMYPLSEAVAAATNEYASSILENYHTGIESNFLPILDLALKEDVSFYFDERCIPFLHFLCTQYMRTKGIKERTIKNFAKYGHPDLRRAWNILIHIFAENIGGGLYLERKRRKLSLIRNETDMAFIVGDQPAINLKSTRPHAPAHLSIYYPISPRLAFILSEVDEPPLFPEFGLSADQALLLNRMIYEASYKQVFSNGKFLLDSVNVKNNL